MKFLKFILTVCTYFILFIKTKVRLKNEFNLEISHYGLEPKLLPHLLHLVQRTVFREAESFAIYGNGEHTRRIIILNKLPLHKLTVIFDDSPKVENTYGIPVSHPNYADEYNFDLLIISSDSYETSMFERAKNWCPKGKNLATIYSHKQLRLS